MRAGAIAALGGAGALACALWWWASGTGSAPSAAVEPTKGGARLRNAPALATRAPALTSHGLGSPLPQDPLLFPGLRDALEALLLDAGDAPDPDALKQRLGELVRQRFGDALATRALALAERYVDYRVALGQLEPPGDAADPDALRTAIAKRDAVRHRYFDADEYGALFADQAGLERYTLARMEVERNPDLSEAQRIDALQGAQTELDPAQRQARAQSIVQLDIAAETAAYNARGMDVRARYADRRARYGDDAARRLAQLDLEDAQWNARLDDYARVQAAHPSPEQLAQWRARQFTAEEQLRLDTALQLRAQANR